MQGENNPALGLRGILTGRIANALDVAETAQEYQQVTALILWILVVNLLHQTNVRRWIDLVRAGVGFTVLDDWDVFDIDFVCSARNLK